MHGGEGQRGKSPSEVRACVSAGAFRRGEQQERHP